jgi:hypothetical protein
MTTTAVSPAPARIPSHTDSLPVGHRLRCACGADCTEGPGKTIHPYLASAFREMHGKPDCRITETKAA